MRKSELLKKKSLMATPKMMKMAADDKPQVIEHRYWRTTYKHTVFNIGLYMRCAVIDGLLKVAFFCTENMRLGGKLPFYELYIDREKSEFLTYDRINKKWLTAKLDMIRWPDSVANSAKKWISDKDSSTLQNYLNTKHSGYRGLLDYQLKVRAEELKRRHKKETDPWDLELLQTPDLPADWEHWVQKVGIPENFMFYKYVKGGAKTGYCTYCEKEVPIKNPRHNKEGTCPCCRRKITFKAEGKSAHRVATNVYYMYLIKRCEDGFMIREFRGYRAYFKSDYRKAVYSCFENRRAVYDHNARPISAYYWGDYKHVKMRWIKCNICSPSWWDNSQGRVYGKTLPDLSKGELKKTGLFEAIKMLQVIDPEKYLAVLQYVPQLEKLSKAKLPRLVQECMRSYAEFTGDFFKRNTAELTSMLGIDTQQLKRLRENDGGKAYLEWLQFEKESTRTISDELIRWFCGERISPKKLEFIRDKMSVAQIHNYICRQMREQKMTSKEVMTTWSDYLSMAQKLEMNTDDEIIYRVRELRKRHDELVEECNRKSFQIRLREVEREYPQVNRICKRLKKIYEYSDEQYVIVAPRGVKDILREGERQHHCVASGSIYWSRIQNHESYILFLRKATAPAKAYYTIEISPDGTVCQVRGEYNRQYADIQQVNAFLARWKSVVEKRKVGGMKTTPISIEIGVDVCLSCRWLAVIRFNKLNHARCSINYNDYGFAVCFWGRYKDENVSAHSLFVCCPFRSITVKIVSPNGVPTNMLIFYSQKGCRNTIATNYSSSQEINQKR